MRPGIVWNKGKTVYCVVVDATGRYWNTGGTPAFEAYDAAHWSNYVFTVTDSTGNGDYDRATIPGPADGVYTFKFYQQAEGSPATGDAPAIWTETKRLVGGVWVESPTAQENADAVAAAVLLDPAHKLATNASGYVTSTNGGGGWGAAVGSGADRCTQTITNSTTGLPVADADVWITSDAGGNNVVAGTLQTNSQGNATFLLDAGVSYYLWMQKDGVNPILGQAFTAVAD